MSGGGPRTDVLWWVLRAQWACGLLLLAALTEIPRAAILASGAAFVAGTVLDRSGAPRAGVRRLTLPLVAVAVAASAADFFLGSGEILFSVSVLLLGIQSVKFLLPKKAGDGWQLCVLSYLEYLAAAGSTTELHFAAFAVVYLGLCAGGMWALQVQRREEQGETAPPVRRGFAAKLLLFSASAGFLLTVVLFAATPRIAIGQILRRLGRAEGITGFSDTISLLDVTRVKVDRRVAARVEFPEPPAGGFPDSLYLRGAIYSRFDGTVWKRRWEPRTRVSRSGFLYFVAPPPRGAGLATAEITLEPMDSPALFVYGKPTLIEGSLGDLFAVGGEELSLSVSGHAALRYRVRFSLGTTRRHLGGPPREPEYLELPPGWEDVRALAARITTGGRSDAERAELALRYFRTGYRYTVIDPASSVREFLFGRRAGFCEHYATAMALILRAAGIPARVAAGYLGGEWSDVGKYLIVRQSDAHAWTEGWIGGEWVILDATPPQGEGSPFFARTGKVGIYLDWARQRWNKYVVNYSLKMQADGVAQGWSALRRGRAFVRRALAPGGGIRRRAGPLAACVAVPVLVAILLRRSLGAFRTGRHAAGIRGKGGVPRPYARLARRLAALGYRRSPGTTLEEMVLGAAGSRAAVAGDASTFLALYHRDRFGAEPLSPAEIREAARLARRLAGETSRSGTG